MNDPHSVEQPAPPSDIRISWTPRERLRILWYRIRMIESEMRYATRRLHELQTRWPE